MMNRASLLFASVPFFVLAACGGNVESEGTGAGTSSSTGTSGTGASTTGTSGTGASSTTSTTGTGASTTTGTTGVGGSTSTGTGASTTTGTSGTGGGACSGYMDLVVGNGAPIHLPADCATDGWNPSMATTAVGYLTEGGPAPGVSNLSAFGCVSKAAGSQGLSLSVSDVTGPGTFTGGKATYTDETGSDWSGVGEFSVTVTKLGMVGDTIEGKLSTAVTHPPSNVAEPITATFKVCHVQDQLVP